MIRFSNAFLCFVQVASSSEQEMVGPKIAHTNAIEWVRCGTFEKRAWSGKRTSTTIARRYPTIGKARDADLSDKMKSSKLAPVHVRINNCKLWPIFTFPLLRNCHIRTAKQRR